MDKRGRGRLSRSADFDTVFRQGRARSNRWFVVHTFPRSEAGERRLGLSVSRKVGGAVERSRVKRLLREAFRAHEDLVPEGHDVVVVARPDARELAQREGLAGISRELTPLLCGEAPADGGPAASVDRVEHT